MPRRSGGGGGGFGGARRASPAPKPAAPSRGFFGGASQPSRPSQSAPPPAPHHAPPPPAHSSGGGMMSGLGGMVAQGMALGTGSALAHRAVDSVLGSRHPDPAQAQQAAEQVAREPDTPCNRQAKTFADCMSDNNGEMESCRYYFDTLQSCRNEQLN